MHRATLNFHTQAEAEAFCQKHGWKYEVLNPKEQTEVRPKRYIGYGDNFRQVFVFLSSYWSFTCCKLPLRYKSSGFRVQCAV